MKKEGKRNKRKMPLANVVEAFQSAVIPQTRMEIEIPAPECPMCKEAMDTDTLEYSVRAVDSVMSGPAEYNFLMECDLGHRFSHEVKFVYKF